MLKIHTYYLSNAEKELKYVGQNISDDELKNLASNSNIWLGDNSKRWEGEVEVEEKNSTSDNISDSESDFYGAESSHNDNFVLEEIIDLNNSMFIGDNIKK